MKVILRLFILISGVVLLLYAVSCFFIFNYNAGLALFTSSSLVWLLFGVFFNRLICYKWLIYGVFSAFVIILSFMAFVFIYGKSDNVTYKEDAVIVLGAGLKGDMVTATLARRLDKAIEYHERNNDSVIIVSGSQGFQETTTEAKAMERYLLNRGIPGEKIIKEENATSTYENLSYSKEILDDLFEDKYKVVVITNDFHVFRANMLAHRLGYDAVLTLK